jgi:O-antigen/teichoic acid export membrane protein
MKIIKIYLSNALPISIKIIGGLFLLQAFVAYLGSEGLGLASQYQSVITMGYGIFNALIFNYAVKNQWSERVCEADFKAFLIWIIRLSMGLAFGVVLLSWPLSWLIFDKKDYAIYIIFAALQMPLVAVYIALSAKMCADKKQVKYNVLVAASTLVAMFAVWYCAKYFTMAEVLAALGFFYVPAFLFQIYASRTELKKLTFKWFEKKSGYDYRPVLQISFVAVVSAFLAIAVQMTARKIIMNEAGWETVGQWQIVNKISESYLLLASIPLFTFFLPKYAALASDVEKKALLLNIIGISTMIIGATGALIFLMWNLVTKLIIGEQFYELQSVFGIQVVGDIFKINCWVLITAALGDNKLKLVLCIEIVFAIFYCGLLYFFFPVLGLGAAIASYGVAYFFVAIALISVYFKKFNEK